MTNVSPGDLALVVGCEDSRVNGAVCEVPRRPAHDMPTWARALSDEEMALMAANPWQILETAAQWNPCA